MSRLLSLMLLVVVAAVGAAIMAPKEGFHGANRIRVGPEYRTVSPKKSRTICPYRAEDFFPRIVGTGALLLFADCLYFSCGGPAISHSVVTPQIFANLGKSRTGIMLLRPPSYFP